jgi:hypothetical protein
MDQEGSLLCSQDSATCSYPELDESSPRCPVLSIENPI